MKKIISKLIISISLALSFLINPSLIFAATLSVSPSSGNIQPGCNFSVNILLDTTGTQTDGTDVVLLYDPSKLSASSGSVVNGKIYQDYPGNSVDTSNGKISISGISSVSTPFSGKGTFATINFNVKSGSSGGTTTLKFDFDPNDKTKTTDTNVVERGTIADVLSSVIDGSYNITTSTGSCSGNGSAPGGTNPGVTNPGGTNPGGNGSIINSVGLPVGGPAYSGSSSGQINQSQLPASGLFDSTMILIATGSLLVILGVLGLALL